MEIFDDGYLAEEEKQIISQQKLIYLAISNYTGNPVKNIFPRNVYEYKLNPNGIISRTRLCATEQELGNEILWDCFINARKPKNPFHFLFYPYRKIEYMDDDGITHDLKINEMEMVNLQMDFVGRQEIYEYIRPIEKRTAYFLGWVSDQHFLKTLKKFS